MFFEVAFMVVVPLVVSIAKEAKVPYMFLIIPVLAAVAQAHSIFPPQPGPVALVDAFGADSGMVYLLGLVVVIPSIICAGIVYQNSSRESTPMQNLNWGISAKWLSANTSCHRFWSV